MKNPRLITQPLTIRILSINNMRIDDSQCNSDITLFDNEGKNEVESKAKPQVLKTLKDIMQNRRKYRAT